MLIHLERNGKSNHTRQGNSQRLQNEGVICYRDVQTKTTSSTLIGEHPALNHRIGRRSPMKISDLFARSLWPNRKDSFVFFLHHSPELHKLGIRFCGQVYRSLWINCGDVAWTENCEKISGRDASLWHGWKQEGSLAKWNEGVHMEQVVLTGSAIEGYGIE